jgi:hypothetical protein
MKRAPLTAGLLVLVLVPFPTTTVPEWRIQYVDAKGQPLAGLSVQQTWQNYSIESGANYMRLQTDMQGYATFPKHTAWAPMLMRIFHPVANVVSTGVHASFGPSSWVVHRCDLAATGETLAVYTGSDLPGKIVLKYEDRSKLRAALPMPVPSECGAIEAQAKNAGA